MLAELNETIISKEEFKDLCRPYPFTEDQKGLLVAMLKEKEYEIE